MFQGRGPRWEGALMEGACVPCNTCLEQRPGGSSAGTPPGSHAKATGFSPFHLVSVAVLGPSPAAPDPWAQGRRLQPRQSSWTPQRPCGDSWMWCDPAALSTRPCSSARPRPRPAGLCWLPRLPSASMPVRLPSSSLDFVWRCLLAVSWASTRQRGAVHSPVNSLTHAPVWLLLLSSL